MSIFRHTAGEDETIGKASFKMRTLLFHHREIEGILTFDGIEIPVHIQSRDEDIIQIYTLKYELRKLEQRNA